MNNTEKKHGWANTVAYGNSYKTMDIASKSTGLLTNELLYRTLSHSNTERLAESFLINTRVHRNDWASESSIANYFTDNNYITLSMRGKGENKHDQIKLPPPISLTMNLKEVFLQRRSVRQYTGDEMDLNYLSTLLKSGSGITGEGRPTLKEGGDVGIKFRTHSSAGGLYPIDIYVVALNVKGLKRNVYRYNPHEESLYPCGNPDNVEKILQGFAVTEESISIRRSNVTLLFIGQPWRVMRKYGNRGMRFVFMEAGAIAQNIGLATTALGYGSTECAATYDSEIHDALQIDGVFQTLVHSMIIGCKG